MVVTGLWCLQVHLIEEGATYSFGRLVTLCLFVALVYLLRSDFGNELVHSRSGQIACFNGIVLVWGKRPPIKLDDGRGMLLRPPLLHRLA